MAVADNLSYEEFVAEVEKLEKGEVIKRVENPIAANLLVEALKCAGIEPLVEYFYEGDDMKVPSYLKEVVIRK